MEVTNSLIFHSEFQSVYSKFNILAYFWQHGLKYENESHKTNYCILAVRRCRLSYGLSLRTLRLSPCWLSTSNSRFNRYFNGIFHQEFLRCASTRVYEILHSVFASSCFCRYAHVHNARLEAHVKPFLVS